MFDRVVSVIRWVHALIKLSVTPTDHPVHSVPSDINECAEVTCDNGATCVDQIANFSCTCHPGYTGKFCQDGKVNNSYVNLLTLEHAPTASAWNAPSFSRGCVLITFQKRFFHSKNCLRAFPIFGMSTARCETTTNSHLHFLAFRRFPVSCPFVSSSQCRRSNLWKS